MILSLLILTIGGLCKMENPKATVVQSVRRGNIVNRHANKVTRQHEMLVNLVHSEDIT